MIVQRSPKQKTGNKQSDVWAFIDEVEEKYADLIDELESEISRKGDYPKMKVTGTSTREIPRIQRKRWEKK